MQGISELLKKHEGQYLDHDDIETLMEQSYSLAIDNAITLAKGQIIYPVSGQDGSFIKQQTFIIVLEHLKNKK